MGTEDLMAATLLVILLAFAGWGIARSTYESAAGQEPTGQAGPRETDTPDQPGSLAVRLGARDPPRRPNRTTPALTTPSI